WWNTTFSPRSRRVASRHAEVCPITLPRADAGQPQDRSGSGRRHDDDAPRGGRDDRFPQQIGCRTAPVGTAPRDDPDLEGHLPTARTDPDQGGLDLDTVPRPDGGPELHVAVGGEQTLVAVGADA